MVCSSYTVGNQVWSSGETSNFSTYLNHIVEIETDIVNDEQFKIKIFYQISASLLEIIAKCGANMDL